MKNKINLYGRARRIAFLEMAGIIIAAVVAIVFIAYMVFSEGPEVTKNENFSMLKQHFLDRGYKCDLLHQNAGKCVKSVEGIKYSFYRYDDGLQYIISTDSYTLVISHRLSDEDVISFKTTAEAFDGYRNQTFTCEFDDNVLGKVKSCESTKDNILLEVKSYLGVIEQAQEDIKNALLSSGYSYDDLVINYKWTEK